MVCCLLPGFFGDYFAWMLFYLWFGLVVLIGYSRFVCCTLVVLVLTLSCFCGTLLV